MPQGRDDEERLTADIIELARQYGRYGYRKIAALLRHAGYVESFNARLRDELLEGEIFYTLKEAQIVIESWRRHYNAVRPHSALQDRTPQQMGAMWVDSRDARESTAINEIGIELEITGASVTFQP